MPIFRITIEKYMASAAEYWTNIYHVDVADLQAAVQQIANFANAERPLYPESVVITKGRADDGIPNTDQYGTQVFNAAGTRASAGQDLNPLFVTARVDFTSAGFGSPSRKFLRGVLYESDVSFSSIGATVAALLNTYGDAIIALPVCDVDGQDLVDAVPFLAPQMRQLRRGSKKKIVP